MTWPAPLKCVARPLLALSIIALASPWGLASAQTRPTIDKLVATFDDVVFGAEFEATPRSNVIAKWSGPLRVSVKGQPKDHHISYLRAHLRSIIDLTGLEMAPVDDQTAKENVTIAFVPASQMSKVKVATVDPKLIQTLAGPQSCYFLSFRETPDEISRSVIVVNKERTARAINHCLLEEVLQSLGLPNDSDLIRPSVFSDLDNPTQLTRSDEILVRALYDPRLKVGTPREEALVVVRTIIEELDASLPPE
ncbi:MAG: DUF2927 domain-containing protein [Rhodospirillales bacterium]